MSDDDDVERIRAEMANLREQGFVYHSSGMNRQAFNGRNWRRYIKNEKRTDTEGTTTVVYIDTNNGELISRATYHARIDEHGGFWRTSIPMQ